MTSLWRHAPDQRSRGSTADAIALVRALGVVVPHEAIEGPLQRRARREVAAPEHHAPVLLENRALQAFDEAVGPGMAGLGACVPDAELTTGRIKGPLELGPAIGEDATHRPSRALVVRDDHVAQERGGRRRIVSGQQAGQPVRGGRIARRDLPDFADGFEIADVEGVQAHEFAGLLRLDVPRAAVASAPQALPGAFGQQPSRPRGLLLEHGQPSAPRGQPDAAQQPLHGAGRQPDPPGPGEVGRDPAAPPGGRADRDPQHEPLHVGRHRHRAPRLGAPPAGVDAVDPIAFQALAPAIEDRPRDAQLAAHRADVALYLRTLDDAQAHSVYALVEGHRFVLPQWFPWPDFHSGKDRTDGPLVRSREVSTLLRVRTL